VDLHIVGGDPTDEERAAVDARLGPPSSGWAGGTRDSARDGRTASGGPALAADRHLLLPALHAVQDRVGWISRGALNYICRRLSVPPAEAWGVLTFYHLLSPQPRPRIVAHVCDDIACRLGGAERLCADLQAALGPPLESGHPSAVSADPTPAETGRPSAVAGAPVPDGDALDARTAVRVADVTVRNAGASDPATPPPLGWQRSPCLGQCDAGRAALIVRAGDAPARFVVAPVTSAAHLVSAMTAPPPEPVLRVRHHLGVPRLLARVGRVDPGDLDSYRASGGYQALARALALGPEGVIAEVGAAGLLGRGGAAFPTARKWEAVRQQAAMPHFVVCNADESEPGTFKDRVLLEHDPFAVVEAMTICALATRSRRGFLYVRGEYPLAEQRLSGAVTQARAAGLLGESILGSDLAFDIELRRGGGAYICGEETALFNSIEGKRGEPRSKPPFPAQVGVFGKPTVANNVETLVNVLDILDQGGASWAQVGTPASTGPRLFCVSGRVERPGLYEVPSGTPLRAVIELAGGVSNGGALRAVLLGGAAGTFVGPAHLDLPLSFEAARAAGTTLGSGVVMVFDDTVDLGDTLRRIAAFFRHESCGQCVPCRIGTVRQQELLDGQLSGPVSPVAERAYTELAAAMTDASICGLGQTAASAIVSARALGLITTERRA
jgi:NADH-quinone oxidoreductase subunit F